MSHYYRLFLIVGLFVLNSALPAQEMRDSKGKDFWIAFPINHSGGTPSLFISSEEATSGTVSIPGMGYSSNFTTTPGTVTSVALTTTHEVKCADSIEDKGIHITALKEVTVYGLSRRTASTDAFLCLPTDILGDSYIIPSYPGIYGQSQLVVIGTQNATSVTIRPTVNAQTRVANVPFTITLNQGQAYQLQANGEGDLTGSLITSNAQIAVFGAVQCANVPTTCTACDFIAEEIPPISTWGKNFISAPLATRSGDIYRFLASEDATTITVNGTAVATLNRGQFFEQLYSTGLHITSDKAISVIQYSRGSSCDNVVGDPFMMLIPPYEQFLGNYTISTTDAGIPRNYINLVVPTRAIGDARVDGSIVPATSFTAIGTSGFHYAAISISVGTHTINCNYPVGVHVYGFGNYDSYGYPGGQSLSQIAYIDSIFLAPPTSTAQTGTSSCVQATVLDNNGHEVPGVRVDFNVSGVNNASGFSFTNTSGVAQYCYTGVAVGKDSIYAVTGSLRSNFVYKTWWSSPNTTPVADAGPDQNLYAGPVDCFVNVTLDGSRSTDPEGDPLGYSWTGPFVGTLSGQIVTANLHVGQNEIALIVSDRGASDTDTVIVTIRDTIPPVPSIIPLPDIISECSYTVSSYPTANDNCSGMITGTTTNPLTFNALGRYTITWTFADSSRNDFTQTQNVIIKDTTPPVPELSELPVVKGECMVQLVPPFAMDNCNGRVAASTSSSIIIRDRGTHTVTWTYTDSSRNVSSQTQTVIINDTTPPVPELAVLPVLQGECMVQLAPPFAMDNCIGRVAASTSSPLIIRDQGTHTVSWTFTDSSRNVSSQTQTVIIKDTTPPVPELAVLPVLLGECMVQLVPPFAMDNCIGRVAASTNSPLTIRGEGEHIVNWIYTDSSGNASTQSQTILINDTTPPVPQLLELPTLYGECMVQLVPPVAIDNCSGQIAASASIPLSVRGQGSHTVVWTYNDGNGNVYNQNQVVILNDSVAPVFGPFNDTTITIKNAMTGKSVLLSRITAIDNCDLNVDINAFRNDGLALDALYPAGTTVVKWKACDISSNCDSVAQSIAIIKNQLPIVSIPADTAVTEGQQLELRMNVSDPDGTIPSVWISNTAVPHEVKYDSTGAYLLTFRTGCNDHGVYAVKVYCTDLIDTVVDSFTLTIGDKNFPPEFQTPDYQIANELIPLNVLVSVSDCDNRKPQLRIVNAPPGAQFIDHNDGTATFSWLPDENDNGYYMVIFEAKDDTMIIRDTIIIEVKDTNGFPPQLSVSTVDTTVPSHLPLMISARGFDRDNTPPLLKAAQLPSGADFTSDSAGSGIFRWIPPDTGVFRFTIIAIDAVDSNISVTSIVKITVTGENHTGPEFIPMQDITIDQNSKMVLNFQAADPDGTTPQLLCIQKPGGASFADNGDGTASVTWVPECDISGVFTATVIATDNMFADTAIVHITVRDINCPPIIHPVADINVSKGEMVQFPLIAYDPDGTSQNLAITVSCDLPGYTFLSTGDGKGLFGWQAVFDTGTYPVTFTVTDGLLTDSIITHINVNKTGTVRISCLPAQSSIFIMPSTHHKGEFLGTDAVEISIPPGVYNFEAQNNGYRSQLFPIQVKADAVVSKVCTLKAIIPLMTSQPDTLIFDRLKSSSSAPFYFADINADGLSDFTIWDSESLIVYYKNHNGNFDRIPTSFFNFSSQKKLLSYILVDWNNDKKLDCIYSDTDGSVVFINLKNLTSSTVISMPGDRCFVTVLDANRDHKKDLVINCEKKGLFTFYNEGTDSSPSFSTMIESKTQDGQSITTLRGALLFADFDGNGQEEMAAFSSGSLSLFKTDSQLTKITYLEDFNCGGKRYTSDSSYCTFMDSPDIPVLAFQNIGKVQLFKTRLCGDVTNDGKVDIRDLGKISKLWEVTEDDSLWNPECNLKLSTSGKDVVDIKDVIRASKSWELQQ